MDCESLSVKCWLRMSTTGGMKSNNCVKSEAVGVGWMGEL